MRRAASPSRRARRSRPRMPGRLCLGAQAPRAAMPLRSQASVNSCSSSRPNSGLLSTLASARSSSGSSSASASAIRSITAMCSVSTSRSAPATGTPLVLQRADDAPRTARRAGAPAPARRRAAGRCAIHSLDRARRSAAPAARAGLSSLSVSNGASQPSISLPLAGSISGHSSTRPGAASGSDSCGGMPASSVVTLTIASRVREHRIDRAEHVLAGAERVLELQSAELQFRPSSNCAAKCAPHRRRTRAAPRPGTRRSTASRRRPRRPCAARSRAPPPAKNSATMALHDLPLLRAGVLRLVDQHVIDAAVELVVHPGGRRVAEQCERLVDQVVVVEQRRGVPSRRDSARSPRRRW